MSGVAIYRSDRFFPVGSVPSGIVFSITGDRAGNIWISHQKGLFQLFQARVVERIPWAKLGRREPASALLHDAMQGGLWLGFRDGGVAYFRNGRIRASYAGSEGLTSGTVDGFYIDRKRTLWAATEGGLSRIHDGSVLTLTSRNGLPCDMVHWMMEDDADSVWLYLACGLVRIAGLSSTPWACDPKQQIRPTVFDSSDRARSLGLQFGYSSVVAKSSDRDSRSCLLAASALSIRIVLRSTGAAAGTYRANRRSGKTYAATNGLRLPPRVRDLGIGYTALSLVAPEKVLRIKLEGQDPDWRALMDRSPRSLYKPAAGAVSFSRPRERQRRSVQRRRRWLEFAIAPAWFQTTWFRALACSRGRHCCGGCIGYVSAMKAREKSFREAVESMPALAFVSQADSCRSSSGSGSNIRD